MKIIRFLNPILIFLITAISIHGQPGIKAGWGASGIVTGNYNVYLGYEVDWIQHNVEYPDWGGQIGIFYNLPLSVAFEMQPELYYASRGMNLYQTELYNISYELNINYVQLPVLLKFNFPVTWKVKPALLAGPYGALKLSAQRKLEIWDEKDTKKVDAVRPFDFGVLMGIQTDFPAWSGEGILEMRISWSLADIMKKPENFIVGYWGEEKAHIVAITLLAGYQFK